MFNTDHTLPPLQQFLSQFDEDDNGCWIWQGKPSVQGYGRFTVNRHTDYVHRIWWAEQ